MARTTAKPHRTTIRMGASVFALRSHPLAEPEKAVAMDLSSAHNGDLASVARVLCGLHGIKGPRPKRQGHPGPRQERPPHRRRPARTEPAEARP